MKLSFSFLSQPSSFKIQNQGVVGPENVSFIDKKRPDTSPCFICTLCIFEASHCIWTTGSLLLPRCVLSRSHLLSLCTDFPLPPPPSHIYETCLHVSTTKLSRQKKMKDCKRINDPKILTDNLPQMSDLTSNAVNSNDSKSNNVAHALTYEGKDNIII